MDSIIKLNDIWKRYELGSEKLTVLKEINLDIARGEFVAITGQSGSGKSTMMHIIGALDTPSWGNIFLNGINIRTMSESALAAMRGRTIGFIFQQFNLLPTFNALENVMMPMELDDMTEHEAKKRAEWLLNYMGLGDRLNHRPSELSGGQQQRVAIARALANDPDVILADEPTGNLDSKTGQFIMNFLEDLNQKGKTIVLVTHELSLVNYASRVIYLKDGKIEKEVHNGKHGRNKI